MVDSVPHPFALQSVGWLGVQDSEGCLVPDPKPAVAGNC